MGMVRFLIRRILAGIIVLWAVASLTFFLFFVAVPEGVVARNLAGRAATPQVIAQVEQNLGLNEPKLVQYGHYLEQPAARQPRLLLLLTAARDDDPQAGAARHALGRHRRHRCCG